MRNIKPLTQKEFNNYEGFVYWDKIDEVIKCKKDYVITSYGTLSKDFIFKDGEFYYDTIVNINKNNWTAKWMKVSDYTTKEISFYCSNCEFPTDYKSNYCSKCGKAMNKESWENLIENFVRDILKIKK